MKTIAIIDDEEYIGNNSTGLGRAIAKALGEEIGAQLTADIRAGLFTVELILP